MRLKIEIDAETTEALVCEAARQRRNASDQAAVMLRTALGLPFPRLSERTGEYETPVAAEEKR